MADKSMTIAWKEEAGSAGEPLQDENGNVRIVVSVASSAYPEGYAVYVPDHDTVKGKTVLDVWAALGTPVE
jgi:hypothetical protein